MAPGDSFAPTGPACVANRAIDPNADYGAMVVYENGVKLLHGGPDGTTFVVRDGIVAVERGRIDGVPGNLFDKPMEESDEKLPRWPNHLGNFVSWVRDRSKPICDVEIGARSVAVCHLLNLAYRYRRELTWDPQSWRFVDDDEANEWLDYERRQGYELLPV